MWQLQEYIDLQDVLEQVLVLELVQETVLGLVQELDNNRNRRLVLAQVQVLELDNNMNLMDNNQKLVKELALALVQALGNRNQILKEMVRELVMVLGLAMDNIPNRILSHLVDNLALIVDKKNYKDHY